MRKLGLWWIAYGVFRLCMGVAAILWAPTATVMFGALLNRVGDPFTWMAMFHALYVCWITLSFACGALGVLGGLATTGGGGSALLIWAGFLSLSDLPFGIALGVYTLIDLFLLPRGVTTEIAR